MFHHTRDAMSALLEELKQLPGVGERTALRLLLHLVKSGQQSMLSLAKSIEKVAQDVGECQKCCMLTTEVSLCSICNSAFRNKSQICVVASIQDLMAIESTSDYRGHYHVLHGTLSPMEGIGPSQLRISGFMRRLEETGLQEVILATPPTVEGEATALYLMEQMKDHRFLVTRIASGIPVGGDLQFSDRLTLSRALMLRRSMLQEGI